MDEVEVTNTLEVSISGAKSTKTLVLNATDELIDRRVQLEKLLVDRRRQPIDGEVTVIMEADGVNDLSAPDIWSLWRHKNGALYRILFHTNLPRRTGQADDDHPVDVVYENAWTGAGPWSRHLSDWHRSFEFVAGPNGNGLPDVLPPRPLRLIEGALDIARAFVADVEVPGIETRPPEVTQEQADWSLRGAEAMRKGLVEVMGLMLEPAQVLIEVGGLMNDRYPGRHEKCDLSNG